MQVDLKRIVTIAGIALIGLFIGTASAQKTTTTETKAFEVISVDGNQLVLRGANGVTKEFTVPEDFRFDVNGKQLSVRELKPGMKGTATITTTTTVKPVTVTEVRNATVMQVSGNSLIVKGPKGIRMFSEADVAEHNMKILRNGTPANIADFRAGDKISATIITEMPPEILTERQVQAKITHAGAAPPAAARAVQAPPAGAPSAAGQTVEREAAPTGKTLPKTASQLPLTGLLGGVALSIGLAMAVARRRRPF